VPFLPPQQIRPSILNPSLASVLEVLSSIHVPILWLNQHISERQLVPTHGNTITGPILRLLIYG
jgi:hypothetical protein